ncbi:MULTISPECIES: type IV conjugative transfer system protein TraL [Pantoea]|uniref:type IV conjugative transfer system protein TraL n=1 Tax=Pantoea TaxID=53335 RepID=UPI0008FD43DD|nr:MULTISPECIES: type IV conjugative transfer system protein TraL [unclassified Pantoea]KAA5971654.1 type IV conjugative transfer system protein TraL [Pantoea sp. M_9]OIX90670.1 type IV conjugative transfer system protein TraL [Pantoea sp. Ae16]
MEPDNTERYRFPKTLSEQLRVLGLPLDELIPVIPVLAWGFWTHRQLFGLMAACAVWFAIRSAKRGRGSMWLYNVMYWYLPGLRAGTVFRMIPDSSFRQWIK